MARGTDQVENKAKKWRDAAYPHVAPVPTRKSRPADARPVAQPDRSRRPSSSSSSAIPSSTASTRTACNCPISTDDPRSSARRRSSRPRPGPARATCRRGIDVSPTTRSSRTPRSAIRSRCRLWKRDARLALRAAAEPQCRRSRMAGAILRDVRMAPGAVDGDQPRREINKASFYGLAKESADTVLPESPLFKPEYAQAWMRSTIRCAANALLDEAGLKEARRRRLSAAARRPDGADHRRDRRRERCEETDVLELVTDHWREGRHRALHRAPRSATSSAAASSPARS
jgi:hypothetical protein